MAHARLTRLETGFLAAAVAEKRRLTEKYRPENLRPGYDGETLLLGSAILDRTQVLVHLARYDGHLSRRFFRAVKQLSDLRRDERKAREARSSAGSYTPTDPYCGRYVPAQAPPPIDTPSPTAGRIGFRASRESLPQTGLRSGRAPAPQTVLTKTTKQTQSRRTPVKSTASKDEERPRGACATLCDEGNRMLSPCVRPKTRVYLRNGVLRSRTSAPQRYLSASLSSGSMRSSSSL